MMEARMFLFRVATMADVLKVANSKIEAIRSFPFRLAFREDGDHYVIDVVVEDGGPMFAHLLVEYFKLWNLATSTVETLEEGPNGKDGE
jgi:hypothetical protein